MFFHHAFDVLDDDIGVVDNNSDRQHYRQERYRICRITDNEKRDMFHKLTGTASVGMRVARTLPGRERPR